MRTQQYTNEELAFAEKLANTPVVNLHEKLLEQATRIKHLEAQLADAKQVANDCRIVADNAIAEAQAAKKDAAKWRLLMSGDILIPASERLPEHTILLMRATTDHFGGVISAVADEDEYFDKLLIAAAMQPKEQADVLENLPHELLSPETKQNLESWIDSEQSLRELEAAKQDAERYRCQHKQVNTCSAGAVFTTDAEAARLAESLNAQSPTDNKGK